MCLFNGKFKSHTINIIYFVVFDWNYLNMITFIVIVKVTILAYQINLLANDLVEH